MQERTRHLQSRRFFVLHTSQNGRLFLIVVIFCSVDMTQNRPLWRLLVASGTVQYACVVVQARNDDDDDV